MPLLLLHAGVADSRMWDTQVDALALSFRVLRCDLRGYGRSPLPDGPFAYHEDVHALLSATGLDTVWLVGASFGAEVAVDYALTHPERVRGMVLAFPNVGGFEPSAAVKAFGGREEALLEARELEVATELNMRMWVDGPHRARDEVDGHVRATVAGMQLRAFKQPLPPASR